MSEISTDYEAIKKRPGFYWMRLEPEFDWSIARVSNFGCWRWSNTNPLHNTIDTIDAGEWIYIPEPTETPDKKPEKQPERSVASLTITANGQDIGMHVMGSGRSRKAADVLAGLLSSLSDIYGVTKDA